MTIENEYSLPHVPSRRYDYQVAYPSKPDIDLAITRAIETILAVEGAIEATPGYIISAKS